jgi:hypothetical protein
VVTPQSAWDALADIRDGTAASGDEIWNVIQRYRPEPDTSTPQPIETFTLPPMMTGEQFAEGMLLALQESFFGVELGPAQLDKAQSFALHLCALTSGSERPRDHDSFYETVVEQARRDGSIPRPGDTVWPTPTSSLDPYAPPNREGAPRVNTQGVQVPASANVNTDRVPGAGSNSSIDSNTLQSAQQASEFGLIDGESDENKKGKKNGKKNKESEGKGKAKEQVAGEEERGAS